MLEPLVEYIRIFSEHARIVTPAQIASVAKIEWDDKAQEDFLVNWETLKQNPEHADLSYLTHTSEDVTEYYLFSESFMVPSFAQNLLNIEKGELIATIVATIRKFSNQHSQIYPGVNLTYPPFRLKNEEVLELADKLKLTSEYSDIFAVKSDEDEIFFYSLDNISHVYAECMANYNQDIHSV